jgi:nucleoside-diphosphate-sugar epimerase
MKHRHEDRVLAAGGVVLRMANLIGPGLHGASVLGEVLAQLDRPGPVRIRDGAPERDFLPVDDAARAVAAALQIDGPAVFNIASGRSLSVRTLVARLLAAAGQAERPVEETAPGGRRSVLRLDIADAAEALGWRPETSLDAALAALVSTVEPVPGSDVR